MMNYRVLHEGPNQNYYQYYDRPHLAQEYVRHPLGNVAHHATNPAVRPFYPEYCRVGNSGVRSLNSVSNTMNYPPMIIGGNPINTNQYSYLRQQQEQQHQNYPVEMIDKQAEQWEAHIRYNRNNALMNSVMSDRIVTSRNHYTNANVESLKCHVNALRRHLRKEQEELKVLCSQHRERVRRLTESTDDFNKQLASMGVKIPQKYLTSNSSLKFSAPSCSCSDSIAKQETYTQI